MSLITGAADISAIFTIFHDGVIKRYVSDQGSLYLTIDIAYLAGLAHPDYRSFHVALHDVAEVSFQTWPKAADAPPSTLHGLADIFIPTLNVLSGEADGNAIKIICNQPNPDSPHCGGELRFCASSALVTDQSGKQTNLAELQQLSQSYWDAWHARNQKAPDSAPGCASGIRVDPV